MKQVLPDVWETAVENPFPGLTTHAYLLTRSENILFYNTGNVGEIRKMAELGGVAYQFISHKDEIGDGIRVIRDTYGAQLVGNALELDAFGSVVVPDVLIEQRGSYPGGVEAIPTPGHTVGSTCFLVSATDGRRYLFTGDTLYRSADGNWKPGYIAGHSRREPLLKSLRLLADLQPDVVFSSAFTGSSGLQAVSPNEWRRQVEYAIATLERMTVAD